jgi:hypothetical protein
MEDKFCNIHNIKLAEEKPCGNVPVCSKCRFEEYEKAKIKAEMEESLRKMSRRVRKEYLEKWVK